MLKRQMLMVQAKEQEIQREEEEDSIPEDPPTGEEDTDLEATSGRSRK